MSSNWKLIYATDASGIPVSGSLMAFRSAVLNGADVKIIYRTRANDVWWSRNCSSINVRGTGSRAFIAATFMEAADTILSASGTGLDFTKDPFALEYHIYNSTGVRVMMKFDYQNHTLITEDVETIRMKWYVKDYDPPWYLHPDAIKPILVEHLLPEFDTGDDK